MWVWVASKVPELLGMEIHACFPLRSWKASNTVSRRPCVPTSHRTVQKHKDGMGWGTHMECDFFKGSIFANFVRPFFLRIYIYIYIHVFSSEGAGHEPAEEHCLLAATMFLLNSLARTDVPGRSINFACLLRRL